MKHHIKEQRQAHCLTQEDLAHLSGVPQSRISEYERGTRDPTDEHASMISRIVGPIYYSIDSNQAVLLQGLFSDALGWIQAVGVLRMLSWHVGARMGWMGAHPYVSGIFPDQVLELPETFRPTPCLSPWNSGNQAASLGYAKSLAQQFPELYRQAKLASELTGESKKDMVTLARNVLSDEAVVWIDACLWVRPDEESLAFAAILGSGGNEARLDYSRAYLRAVESLYRDGAHLRWGLWESFLTGKPMQIDLPEESCGAFGRMSNPWAIIATIEGCIAVGSRAVNRLSPNPWSAKPSVEVPSSPLAESSRGDLWLPIWEGETTYDALLDWIGDIWGPNRPTSPVSAAILCASGQTTATSFVRASVLQRNGQSHMLVRL